ncbi:hypothetical protein QEZ48_16320 [Aquamicrobium lusatiense]|uniref:hypothetical protein n=1 Tax=Aquamicrobium lusatiense TaxID=89772 RepID=UPI0024591128|nr:hypothetical protein [Aquamicrobium lusatiense]MDH4992382.1 hypothetical protein [Aquamicrobium lusatiense]
MNVLLRRTEAHRNGHPRLVIGVRSWRAAEQIADDLTDLFQADRYTALVESAFLHVTKSSKVALSACGIPGSLTE